MKVMIADDSIVFRSALRQSLDSVEGIEVVSSVVNGQQAINKLLELPDVDILILDLEMPVMDGLSTIHAIKEKKIDVGIIVFSSFSQAGAQRTLEALTAGAHDFLPKTDNDAGYEDGNEYIEKCLVPKILDIFKSRTKKSVVTKSVLESTPAKKLTEKEICSRKIDIINIGSSTGGPDALKNIFLKWDVSPGVPVLITQHMPRMFTKQLSEMLDRCTEALKVKEAEDNEVVQANYAYVAPGDYHMTFVKEGSVVKIRLNQEDKVNSVRPSVDVMIDSVSKLYPSSINCILTGMGEDGMRSCLQQKLKNNPVLIQSEDSCVVFGMPGAIFRKDAFDYMGNLEELVFILNRKWRDL